MSVSVPINISALPQRVNLNLYVGDDFFIELVVTDDDGNPFDLTGYLADAQVRLSATATDIQCTFDATIDQNIVALHLARGEAANLPGKGVWDCQVDGERLLTLIAGDVTAAARVTRVTRGTP